MVLLAHPPGGPSRSLGLLVLDYAWDPETGSGRVALLGPCSGDEGVFVRPDRPPQPVAFEPLLRGLTRGIPWEEHPAQGTVTSRSLRQHGTALPLDRADLTGGFICPHGPTPRVREVSARVELADRSVFTFAYSENDWQKGVPPDLLPLKTEEVPAGLWVPVELELGGSVALGALCITGRGGASTEGSLAFLEAEPWDSRVRMANLRREGRWLGTGEWCDSPSAPRAFLNAAAGTLQGRGFTPRGSLYWKVTGPWVQAVELMVGETEYGVNLGLHPAGLLPPFDGSKREPGQFGIADYWLSIPGAVVAGDGRAWRPYGQDDGQPLLLSRCLAMLSEFAARWQEPRRLLESLPPATLAADPWGFLDRLLGTPVVPRETRLAAPGGPSPGIQYWLAFGCCWMALRDGDAPLARKYAEAAMADPGACVPDDRLALDELFQAVTNV